MYQISALELPPAESAHLIEPDSYDSDMSYVIFDNPDKVPNDVTTALPLLSQDLNLPDGTVSLMHQRIKDILHENVLLKEKMKHGNSVMTEQLNSISNWHNQIYQTHEKYRDTIKKLTEENEKLHAENHELEKKLEDSEQMVVICQESNSIDDSPCVEDTLLQSSDSQSQISNTICKFSEEKVDVENYKKLLDKEKELHSLQETHKFVQNEYYNTLSLISVLEEEKKKLTLIIREQEASMAKISQEKQDKDLMFTRASKELEELKASQEKNDELRKQSSEKLSEMTVTLLVMQKKLAAAEETADVLKRTSEEELKASQEKSDELRKQSSERLSEMTITLADTQKKLEASEKTVEELKRTSEEELKASQEKSDELRKQSSERLSEMTITLADTQKKLEATEETVEELKRKSEELEELKASQEKSDELRKQSSERLTEMTITLADTQKKLEAAEKTVEELKNTLKEMENLKASHERSEEMRKETSEALSKVTATLTEVTATLTDNQKKLLATEEAVEKLKNELKLKEEELKVSQDAYRELTKQQTEKLEMLEVTQNKLVAAEEAAKNFSEIFETLESEALKYKEELEKVQSSNRENMSNVDELKKVIASYSDELEKSNDECERHKENQKATELTLVKISEEQERWKRAHDSVEREISDSEISSAWEQVHVSEGQEKEAAWENLITAYQEQLETVTSKLYDTQKALEEEQEKTSQLNTSIQEIVVSSNEAVNELLARSSHEAGATASGSTAVASTFRCPLCSCCFSDIFYLQSHVEECLNTSGPAEPFSEEITSPLST